MRKCLKGFLRKISVTALVYSLQVRTEIIFIYGEEQRCTQRTAQVFKHPDRNVGRHYVLDIVQRFEETRSVYNKIVKNRRLSTEGHFAMDPQTSKQKVSRLTNIS